jgi:phospholipid transport system substrate-binding protein
MAYEAGRHCSHRPGFSQGTEHMLIPLKAANLRMLTYVLPVLLLSAVAPLAPAQDLAPDVLVRTIAQDAIDVIRQYKDIQAGNPGKIADLVETKILPHFDVMRTTQIAMGHNWRRATPAQQERLAREFGRLLLRTYSTALTNYRDQTIEYKPLRAQPGDAEVTVRSEVRQPGSGSIAIEYYLGKTASGWKIYDLKISGARLATSYRDTFAEKIRNQGIDGLIGSVNL